MNAKIPTTLFTRIGVPKFEKYLNLASLRHKLVAGNVANASTPGYKSRNIDFQAEFNKATQQTRHIPGKLTHNSHIPLGQHQSRLPEINEEKVSQGEMNSVDIDKEVSTMAQNELLYTTGARLLQKKFEGIRKAITSE